jgi:hypothetical protein
VVALLASTAVSCSGITGTAVYKPDPPDPSATLVRATGVAPLVIPPAEIGPTLGAPELAQIPNPPIAILPPDALSDPTCGAVIAPGLQTTYRTSGFLGAEGLTAEDQHENHIAQTVAVFPSPGYARAFVGANVAQWKGCIERPVTVGFGGYTSTWMAFGPSHSDGIDVALVRREGGRGYACSRAIGARTNVTADVVVCGRDETVVTGQSSAFVTAVLDRIPA